MKIFSQIMIQHTFIMTRTILAGIYVWVCEVMNGKDFKRISLPTFKKTFLSINIFLPTKQLCHNPQQMYVCMYIMYKCEHLNVFVWIDPDSCWGMS